MYYNKGGVQMLVREKVLRDPIHNYIYIQHPVILDLLNCREFQRLRRIKQLGTTSYSFHGAEHSRFSHSVGVYEITRQICDLFARNYPSQTTQDGLWNDNERLVALCAALLHDIGHGPYSHTFEKIFNTDHEEMTCRIILDKTTQIHQILANTDASLPKKVVAVIQKTYPNQQVVQMISSQLDADRMDYLLRDSYFTGAKYGTFDLTRILRVMRPYKGGITFDFEGMHAVEDYIVSRFQMYQQIYFYPVSRSMEVLLGNLLARAKDLFLENKLDDQLTTHFLKPFFAKNEIPLQTYLSLDDHVLNTCFNIWQTHEDPILSDLAQRFCNRQPFKSLKNTPKNAQKINEIKQALKDAKLDEKYYTALNDSYDSPYAVDDAKKKTPITLFKDCDDFVELSNASAIVNAIRDKQVGDERFFFPKEFSSI